MTGENEPVEDVTGRRLVVVTGASSGIGLAASVELARGGDRVVLVGRDLARLTAAGERVREAAGGERPELFRADFAVLDDVRGLAGRLRSAYDRIDVLILINGMKIILRAEQALTFEVVELEERAGAWYGKEPGVVRPRLPWSTILVEEGPPSAVGSGEAAAPATAR